MKKIFCTILTIIIVSIFCACSNSTSNNDVSRADSTVSSQTVSGTFKKISSSEAQEIIENEKGYLILDVRTDEEYKEGHIPGAVNIPNETISEETAEILPDKNQKILVYCRSGRRSKQAAQKLADMGYTNIIEFGGIIDWQGEITKE